MRKTRNIKKKLLKKRHTASLTLRRMSRQLRPCGLRHRDYTRKNKRSSRRNKLIRGGKWESYNDTNGQLVCYNKSYGDKQDVWFYPEKKLDDDDNCANQYISKKLAEPTESDIKSQQLIDEKQKLADYARNTHYNSLNVEGKNAYERGQSKKY